MQVHTGRTHAHLAPKKLQSTVTPCCRRLIVSKATSSDGLTGRLFQQHKVLLEAGFSYDQAALILQVSQQRKAAAQQLESVSTDPVTQPVSASPDDTPAAAASTTDGPSPPQAVLKPLEDRIAFLELELLKQSLSTSPLSSAQLHASTQLPAGYSTPNNNFSNSSSTRYPTPGSLSSTAAALNPAGAGSGGLNAAAAATARWHADSSLYRQQQGPGFAGSSGALTMGPELPDPHAVTISSQLATAADLGQLEPEVYALAETLAVRQGFAALPAEPHPEAYTLPLQSQQQQHGRPVSIWGRSGRGPVGSGVGARAATRPYLARPQSANAWGDQLYDPAAGGPVGRYGDYGEPLARQGLEEEVPYEPGGWAVAGTIVMVYLGVIVTFLAMCVGDMPY